MLKSLLAFSFILLFQFQSFGQEKTTLGFFEKVLKISHYFSSENKERLKRELHYFAQKSDRLIGLKKEIASEMLDYCAGNTAAKFEVEGKINQYSQKIKHARSNLESIRKNVIFESDFKGAVDTIYEPIEVNPAIVKLEKGCYLKKRLRLQSAEEKATDGTEFLGQRRIEGPSSSTTTKSDSATYMYCPLLQGTIKPESGWKKMEFEDLMNVYKYSLDSKSGNVQVLFGNCNKESIIRERNIAVQALREMRDKALELEKNM